jgi:hypothetical protein
MAKDPGSNLKSALKLNIGESPRNFSNQIGGSDKLDVLRIVLGRRSTLNLALTRLKANANLALLDSRGKKIIAQSRKSGKRSESIITPLDAGTYYVRVTPGSRRDNTRYRLTFSAGNTAPTLTSASFKFRPGGVGVIDRNVLASTDAEQQTSEIIYTLTNLPQNGRLALNGTELGLGGRFTQADIDSGRLSYTSPGKLTRLTNDDTNDAVIGISGSNIVWNKQDGQAFRAFFYNGQTGQSTQLTSAGITSAAVYGVSGSKAVWIGFNGATNEVFLFDAATGSNTKITNNNLNEIGAAISGDNLAWNVLDGQVNRSFFYNGQTGQTTEITSPGVISALASGLDGSKVVWFGFKGNNFDVFLFDAATGNSTQLTNTPINESFAFISGSNVTWVRTEGQINKTFFYNGQTGQTTEITAPGITSASINAISGANLIWTGFDGTDNEVFFYNGATGTSTQLTSNTINEIGAGISGTNLIWLGFDGADSDVFFYDGTSTTQLSNNNLNDGAPLVSGANVAWTVLDGSDTEVASRTFAANDQFSFTISDGLGGVTNGTLNITVG